jgi:hypothetical protein
MRVAVKRLRVEDVEKLHALVIENFDAIEPGLTVLDARLLLGHATIDVIGTDPGGTLILGAVGFTANEEMLLKAVEAYSWCLEYPQALQRHYPSCHVSEARPPRLLFVVERTPDAFHRKIKQLGFPEVDCVEFRHLEFDGTPTVYFESILRLRRHAASPAARVTEPELPASTGDGASHSGGDKVVTMNRAPARGLEGPGLAAPGVADTASAPRTLAGREPAPVVNMVNRPSAAASPRPSRSRTAAAPVILEEAESAVVMPDPVALELDPIVASLCEPPAAAATPAAATDAVPAIAPTHVVTATAPAPERVPFKDLATSLLGATTETQEALANAVATAMVKPESSAADADAAAPSAAGSLEASQESPFAKSVAAAKPATPVVPEGFEGLKFPQDAVLTRQWMEFLNQMSATK